MPIGFIRNQTFMGFLFTFLAFLMWGVLPVYWQNLFYLPPVVITCYRVIFSMFFVTLAILLGRERGLLLDIWRDKRSIMLLFVCGAIVGFNWSIYMYAIAGGRVMQASMGYYMNPLVSALFGIFLFKESLRPLQKIAMLLMAAGVVYMIFRYGSIPGYSMMIAVSFALYGAMHKLVKVKVLHGMFFEMLLLLIPALVVIMLYPHSPGFFGEGGLTRLLIIFAGPFTALPLMGYAFGVQRLKLITVGIIQYISPTATFLLGVFWFKEPFNVQMLVVFIFIWLGVASYLVDGVLQSAQQSRLLRGR